MKMNILLILTVCAIVAVDKSYSYTCHSCTGCSDVTSAISDPETGNGCQTTMTFTTSLDVTTVVTDRLKAADACTPSTLPTSATGSQTIVECCGIDSCNNVVKKTTVIGCLQCNSVSDANCLAGTGSAVYDATFFAATSTKTKCKTLITYDDAGILISVEREAVDSCTVVAKPSLGSPGSEARCCATNGCNTDLNGFPVKTHLQTAYFICL